jgi:hypothetical protein
MSVLRPKPKNSSLRFWGQIGRNCPSVFEVKPLTNRRPWFWGSTKKLVLLLSMCTVQNAHGVTRPPDRPTTEYPTCAIISVPLHHVSYSCHDPRHCPPCHTFHLHTMRQLNVILHMKQGINVNYQNNLDSNSSLNMSMTITYQTKILISWFLLFQFFCPVFKLPSFLHQHLPDS